jgi:hypothetical protein
VHLVGFITKKFVMMHGHMNVKKTRGILFTKCVEQQNEFLQITLERADLLSVLFNDADRNGYTAETVYSNSCSCAVIWLRKLEN